MLFARLLACWRLKLLLTVVLGVLFWSGYGVLGRNDYFPLRTAYNTWLDRSIPYQPLPWSWIYLSQFLVVNVLPLVLVTRKSLVRYSAGFGIITAVSFVCFLFFPIAGPRPRIADTDLTMRLIRSYDGTLNCFPSLHAAFLCYTALLTWRIFGRDMPVYVVVSGAIWSLAILISTLAIKQHYLFDLAAGGLLGWLAESLAWKGSQDDSSVARTIPHRSACISDDGTR